MCIYFERSRTRLLKMKIKLFNRAITKSEILILYLTECFIRSKTGIRLDRRTVRYTLSVNSPVECEQECVNAQFFTCRSFSFRYPGSSSFSSSDPYHKAYDNCDLSDIDILSLDPLRDLLEDRLYDTWQRTSYRDCEFANTIGYGRTPSTTAIATSPSDINGITPIGIIHHPNSAYIY